MSLELLRAKIDECRQPLLDLGPQGDRIWRMALDIEDVTKRHQFLLKALDMLADEIRRLSVYKDGTEPVDIETFLTDGVHFPPNHMPFFRPVMDALIEINSGEYSEVVLTGGIGTSKTTIAIFSQMYQVYLMSKLRNPQAHFGLGPQDEIMFIFQSLRMSHAKELDYGRFRSYMDTSPYFRDQYPYKADLESRMEFPNRIFVKPVSSATSAAIGFNVFGGMIDEVNFMQVTENSKQSLDGATYSQAHELYRAIRDRRESRFMQKGKVPGLLCLVSSKQTPGEFTEERVDAAKKELAETGKTRIYVYDKRTWEVNPARFSPERFKVFIGSPTKKPFIAESDEQLAGIPEDLILHVPTDYKTQFQENLLQALRDIGGKATLAMHPFILDTDKVTECFGQTESILSRDDCDFKETTVQIFPKRFRDLTMPRFVHVDLSHTGDSTGIACGYVPKFKEIKRSAHEYEVLPQVVFDFVLEVRVPRNGEIIYDKVRTLLYKCRELGLPIKWVTFDTYQSTDSRQILAQRGFSTGVQSMDDNTENYDVFKTAILDGRVWAPKHDKAMMEISRLEFDTKKKKVDHPASGSKDSADSMCGVVAGLTKRLDIWTMHKIPITMMPKHLLGKVKETAS